MRLVLVHSLLDELGGEEVSYVERGRALEADSEDDWRCWSAAGGRAARGESIHASLVLSCHLIPNISM